MGVKQPTTPLEKFLNSYQEYPQPFWILMAGTIIDRLETNLIIPFLAIYVAPGSREEKGGVTMKWITRSHVHVDRVACPWLITRFIDSEAEFLFVPKSEIDRVTKETGAIPFDAPGVELGHHEGRCSFESIILKYDLHDAGLFHLAKIVHAADIAEDIDTNPIARGLEAIASGYSLRFPDDMENLKHQFEVYDSLYSWCRLQLAHA